MQKLFSHPFSQNIWRILPDSNPDSNLWAIELRDVERKQVYFSVIDIGTHSVKWVSQVEATDWWSSITGFINGNVFVHNYRYPDLPEPTDLLMLSSESGNLQWVLPNYVLSKALGDHFVQVAKRQGDQFQYLKCDTETGSLLAFDETERQKTVPIILGEPIRYKKGNLYFDRLAKFISNGCDGHEAACIDYLEKRPIMVFSYYIYDQEKTVQYLFVVNDNLERIFHERLSEGRDGIGRSTMFLKNSTLVFLKNNNEFSSLTLS